MTRLGLLSDSHGRAAITQRAATALRAAGAERLIHLGDIETNEVLEALLGGPVSVVFGNCDDERALGAYAECLDFDVAHPVGHLEIDGCRITFTHGHFGAAMREAIAAGTEYLLHGHTHVACDERVERTRVINPGALFRSSRYTVAILDPGAGDLEWIDVPRVDS